MKIRDTCEAGVHVLHMEGDFGGDTAESLYAHLDQAIDRQHFRVVLDAQGVGAVTSGALVALVRARKRLLALGGGLAIAHLPPAAFDALHSVGLDRRVTCFDTVDEAVSHFDDAVPCGTTVLGELAATPHGVWVDVSLPEHPHASSSGPPTCRATLDAIGLRGAQFSLLEPTLVAETERLLAPGAPLRLGFELLVDHTHYPVSTVAHVVSRSATPPDRGLRVVAEFTHLLVADRMVIEMYLHHGRDDEGEPFHVS
jgi:anti-anti-sigma factor